MESPWKELTFLLLGWLLALLAGPIQYYTARHRERTNLKRALWTELKDLRERLALAAFLIDMKDQGLTKELVNWTRKYIVPRSPSFPSSQLDTVAKRLAEVDDDKFDAAAGVLKETGPDSLALKRCQLPYLSTRIDRFDLLPEMTAEHLLAVLTHLDILNQHVSDSEFYRNLTFSDSISEENHVTAKNEIIRCRSLVAQQARTMVRMIDGLDAMINKR